METNIHVTFKTEGLRNTNEIHCFIYPASKPILRNCGLTNTKHKSDMRLILFSERPYTNAGRLDEQ